MSATEGTPVNDPKPTSRWVPLERVRACEVRPGDTVIEGASPYRVRHAMTTGKKAQTTSLTPAVGDPRHYAALEMLTICGRQA